MTQVLIVFLIDRVHQNQNLDIVVVLRAPLKYYNKKKTYACILFSLNLHIAQGWQLIS